MAARLRPEHQDEVRQKIRASHLVRRLQDNALGKLPTELSQGQISSIKILLGKCLADLANVQVTGPSGGPVQMTISWGKPDAS